MSSGLRGNAYSKVGGWFVWYFDESVSITISSIVALIIFDQFVRDIRSCSVRSCHCCHRCCKPRLVLWKKSFFKYKSYIYIFLFPARQPFLWSSPPSKFTTVLPTTLSYLFANFSLEWHTWQPREKHTTKELFKVVDGDKIVMTKSIIWCIYSGKLNGNSSRPVRSFVRLFVCAFVRLHVS